MFRRGNGGGEKPAGPNPVENGLRILAEICNENPKTEGVVTFALKATLDVLLPEQRAALLYKLLGHLSPGSRLAIIAGSAPLSEIRASLEAREKWPGIIKDLVDHGREAHEIDPSLVPEGSRLEVMLFGYRPGKPPDNPEGAVPPWCSLKGVLNFASQGNGVMSVISAPPLAQSSKTEALPPGTQLRLSCMKLGARAASDMICFGGQLVLSAVDGGRVIVAEIPNRDSIYTGTIVGAVYLDDESVFKPS